MSLLLPDNIKDWLLHAGQLGIKHAELLHLEHLLVAGPEIEGVAPLGEVVHHVTLVEDGNLGGVAPRDLKRVV